jgi:hypothetical protein
MCASGASRNMMFREAFGVLGVAPDQVALHA